MAFAAASPAVVRKTIKDFLKSTGAKNMSKASMAEEGVSWNAHSVQVAPVRASKQEHIWEYFKRKGVPEWKRREMLRESKPSRDQNIDSLKSISQTTRERMQRHAYVDKEIEDRFERIGLEKVMSDFCERFDLWGS